MSVRTRSSRPWALGRGHPWPLMVLTDIPHAAWVCHRRIVFLEGGTNALCAFIFSQKRRRDLDV